MIFRLFGVQSKKLLNYTLIDATHATYIATSFLLLIQVLSLLIASRDFNRVERVLRISPLPLRRSPSKTLVTPLTGRVKRRSFR
jgi:hypothetical protein